MASKIKTHGNAGNMLMSMAARGGCMTTDRLHFPPSKVMFPLRRRGLVTLKREGVGLSRFNVWHLTDKGWAAIGLIQPEIN